VIGIIERPAIYALGCSQSAREPRNGLACVAVEARNLAGRLNL
jgi:hypothetical protein